MHTDTSVVICAIIVAVILIFVYSSMKSNNGTDMKEPLILFGDYPYDYSRPFAPAVRGYDPWDRYGLGGDTYLGGGIYHHGGRYGWFW